jgi:hypothetical protein
MGAALAAERMQKVEKHIPSGVKQAAEKLVRAARQDW